MFHLNRVILRATHSWLIFGKIPDFFSEFFITQHENLAQNDNNNENYQISDFPHHFSINYTYLPPYLEQKTAKKIKFIGQTVNIFKTISTNLKNNNIQPSNSKKRDNKSLIFSPIAKEQEQTEESPQNFFSEEEEEKFYSDLQKFENNPVLDTISYSKLISDIYETVEKRLFARIEKITFDTIKNIKKFFLTGRADIFTMFLSETESIMKGYPEPKHFKEIQAVFNSCLKKTLNFSEEECENFLIILENNNNFRISTQNLNPEEKFLSNFVSNWKSKLKMEFKIKWPLQIIFSSKLFAEYNKIFSFLLLFLKIQQILGTTWKILAYWEKRNKISKKNKQKMEIEEENPQKQKISNHFLNILCNKMINFVNRFWYYLQVDVITFHYSKLKEKMKSRQEGSSKINGNFKEIKRDQIQFLDSISKASFLETPKISKQIVKTLDICGYFCECVEKELDKDFPFCSDSCETEFTKLDEDFDNQFKFFVNLMKNFQNSKKSGNLHHEIFWTFE